MPSFLGLLLELHHPRETCFCVYSRGYPDRSIRHEETQSRSQRQTQGAEPTRFLAGVPASTAAAAISAAKSTMATTQLAVWGPFCAMDNGNGQPCQTTGSCFLDAIAATRVRTTGTKLWTNGPAVPARPSLSSRKSCRVRHFTSSWPCTCTWPGYRRLDAHPRPSLWPSPTIGTSIPTSTSSYTTAVVAGRGRHTSKCHLYPRHRESHFPFHR